MVQQLAGERRTELAGNTSSCIRALAVLTLWVAVDAPSCTLASVYASQVRHPSSRCNGRLCVTMDTSRPPPPRFAAALACTSELDEEQSIAAAPAPFRTPLPAGIRQPASQPAWRVTTGAHTAMRAVAVASPEKLQLPGFEVRLASEEGRHRGLPASGRSWFDET